MVDDLNQFYLKYSDSIDLLIVLAEFSISNIENKHEVSFSE